MGKHPTPVESATWSVYLPERAIGALFKNQVLDGEILPRLGDSLPKHRGPGRSLDNFVSVIHREAIHSSSDLYFSS